nr:protein trichome birefringence-like 19 [Ipomoea batatas]
MYRTHHLPLHHPPQSPTDQKMPSNSSSSPFPWLPPLNSHPTFAVYITAQQKQFEEDNYSTHTPYPEFVVDFHVRTKFYSEDQTKKYCPETEIKHLPSYFSYRRAFQTAFRAINGLESFNGVVFLRSFAPSHFENGPWDKGGDCKRTEPLKKSEKALDDYNLEFYKIQLQELKAAQIEGRRKGMKLRWFDATVPMLLRADGHPSRFGRLPNPNVTLTNDCVHWCLPGPIDSWNDFLVDKLVLICNSVGFVTYLF